MSEELHRALRKIVCEYENSREDAAEVAFTMVDIARKALSAQQAAGEAEAVRPAVPSKNGFLSFWYENYRGELSERVAIPIRIYHGATEWHPEPQWLLEAWDMEKDAVRAFAMSDMQAPPQPTETVSAGDFYADLYARSCALIGVLRTALKPFAGIKADDGDNFDGYPNDVVIRVETTAGELKNARAAMGDTVLVSEALAPQPPETQRIVASLLDELILLAHQYRSDLIYPLADDSRERRIAAIDAVLAKTGEK